MNVYVVIVNPNDYDNSPYILGVYLTKENAEHAIREMAIEQGEPMLLLQKYFDVWENADCWNYPNEDNLSCYYVYEIEVNK